MNKNGVGPGTGRVTGELPDNKHLGTVQNNDINNILHTSSGKDATPAEYRTAVEHLLDCGCDLLAQNVGMPDAVIYRTKVATGWEKYLLELHLETWPNEDPEQASTQVDCLVNLANAGTDPLQITIEACRQRGVAILASYRMNAEDLYGNTWRLSDFGRAHSEWRIPDSGALDPALPEVYEYRMRIFTEVAEQYDVDGIEFDFRRWCKMISNPHENHPILTRMVRETRAMLDAAARRKGRERLILGARVGPSLNDPPGTEYPGGRLKNDVSCRELGLDVKTWVEEELVDYVCPSLFWPRLPGVPKTAEFVALAKGKNIGIYPTVFPLPAWAKDEVSIPEMSQSEIRTMMRRHRDEICSAALQCFSEGADGISTFNWFGHSLYSPRERQLGTELTTYRDSLPYRKTETFVHRFLKSPQALRDCLRKDPQVILQCEWLD
jgi:hypothetical protein